MIDLKKMLAEDETYKKLLESAPENERKHLESYMNSFMEAWQESIFSPLQEKIENDKEFAESLKKELSNREEIED